MADEIEWKLYYPKSEKHKKALSLVRKGVASIYEKKVHCEFCTNLVESEWAGKPPPRNTIFIDNCVECNGARVLEAKVIILSKNIELLYAYRALKGAKYVAPNKEDSQPSSKRIDLSKIYERQSYGFYQYPSQEAWEKREVIQKNKARKKEVEDLARQDLLKIIEITERILNKRAHWFYDDKYELNLEQLIPSTQYYLNDIKRKISCKELSDEDESLLSHVVQKLEKLVSKLMQV